MALKVRDIFVSLGFDIDNKDLDNLDRALVNVQRSVKGMTILFGGASLAIGAFLKAAGDFEQVEIAFETMLGSAERAQELLDGLKEDARQTPFTLPGILEGAKRLLAFGIEADNVRDSINVLGNIAAGVGRDKFPQLILAFGQVSTATKLRGQELRQFTEAGVPLLEELAKQLGVAQSEVADLVSRGEVSFDMVNKALTNLTTGSGRFANLMERQSKSFLGILSNIQDFVIINAIAIGKELLPQAKAIATEFLTLLEVNREIIKSKMVKFFKELAKNMAVLFKVAKAIVEAILNISGAFGGLGQVVKAVTFAILAFTGIQILSAIGSMTQAVFGLVKAMAALRSGVLLTQAAAVAMPILIGAAVIALGVIVEDIIGYFRGKNSITGLIVDSFEKKFPDAFLNTQAALFAIKETIGIIIDETKLLFGFLNEFLISKPVQAFEQLRGKIRGVGEFLGFGDTETMTPITSPAQAAFNNNSNQIRIDAPISVSVPEGTPPALVGSSLKEGFKESFNDMIRQAQRQLSPVIE